MNPIEIKNLNFSYDQTQDVVKDVSFVVKKGSYTTLIGHNGSGKSTIAKLIIGLLEKEKGSILIDGEELRLETIEGIRRKIGIVFQNPDNQFIGATVRDDIAFGLENHQVAPSEMDEIIENYAKEVGMSEYLDHEPTRLSGGQKQRVGIARALANNPKVLLCDEATSALDPQTTKSILDLLKDINQSLQLTIVLITHEMQVIKEICDKVAVIENGKIIEQGPVIDIFSKPQQETTRDFISAIINHDLPEIFQGTEFSPEPINNGHLVLRISFMGHSTEEPIIAGLIRRFDIDISILYGNVDHIKTTPYGTLLLELSGDVEKIQEALSYLQEKQLGIEVIGYVARHDNVAS